MTFCKTNRSRNWRTISCGSIGLDGADPMLRKKEPLDFNTRRISVAHLPHHSKYDSRFSLSEYFEYLIPKLYGGDVTVISTQLSGRFDIPATQSPRRRS